MPHMNRIRVNNVKYNFGTQFYDDFVMRFDGKNALYDLANGGGKSVLMMLLFQNVLPNSTLDDKQPLEKLFRTNDGSTTIHSLIEWNLDEHLIRDDYKYMLTGFCARKAKSDIDQQEKTSDSAAVDYFNYVIFYRGYNDNDIVNLPLSQNGQRITYSGLKGYLKELGRKDFSLDVRIFDRKGEYQRFIAGYGLYESQWEIIRGINKTEGHVRTYFETHYRTTRKVVEDLLIEEIIQKSFDLKNDSDEGQDQMASTLLSIKDKLMELSQKKQDIQNYDRQTEVLNRFAQRIETLHNYFEDRDQFCYELVKTWHTLEVLGRQWDKEQALFAKERELAQGHVDDISRKLETVQVQEEKEKLAQMDREIEKEQTALEKAESDLKARQEDIHLKESINDFIDYLETEKKAAVIRQSLESSGEGTEDALSRLKRYAGQQKIYFDRQIEELEVEKKVARVQIKDNFKHLEELTHLQRELDKELAVESNTIKVLTEQKEEFTQKISRLKRELNALLVDGSEREIRNNQIEQKKCREKIEILKEQMKELEQELQQLHIRWDVQKEEARGLERRRSELETFLENFAQLKEKAEKLKDIYKAADYDGLKSAIWDRYRKTLVDLYVKRRHAEDLKKQQSQLAEGIVCAPTAQTAQVMDYIRRYHQTTCIYGSDYIQDLTLEVREELLTRLPFLPYAVLVQGDYEMLAGDHIFREKDFGPEPVPVLNMEAVLSEGVSINSGHVLFAGRNNRLFTDEYTVQSCEKEYHQKLDDIRREIARLEDNEETYLNDIDYVGNFMAGYMEPYMDKMTQLSEQSGKFSVLKSEMDTTTEMIARVNGQLEELAGQIRQQEMQCAQLARDEAVLQQIFERNQKLEETQRLIEETVSTRDAKQKQYDQVTLDLINETQNQKEYSGKAKQAEAQIQSIKSRWDACYSLYYEPGEYAEPEEDSSDLEIRFMGLKDAFEKDHTDIEQRQQLIGSYEKSMEMVRRSITARGIAFDDLMALSERRTMVAYEDNDLVDLREKLKESQAKVRQMQKQLERVNATRNRLCGSVENAIRVIEGKYGIYKEVSLKNMSYEIYRQEHEATLQAMRDKLVRAGKNMDKSQQKLRVADDYKREIQRLMRLMNVKSTLTRDCFEGDIVLRKKMDRLNAWYDQLCKDELHIKDEFMKIKDTAVETLRLMKAHELSNEIKNHVNLPSNKEEAMLISGQISDTIQVIVLEKERIGQGIKDISLIKENFESQCLQRCNQIRSELDRLKKMSRIILDDEAIQIVTLKIPYVKEEFQRQLMSSYIDKIIANCDTYSDPDARLKYLKNQLSLKHIFSVIVTDMNAVRLNLYKRERIKEQSRYLRYEEAVGSTGQSQGIYIQFLIAIINYIASIYQPDMDHASLKKSLFIDNPFGAAKDIYIWEPIFKLLKTNNVQLIVPARGATPAITGCFDVNYVLGQKLINKKQQTVVVDYHSNVQADALEYVRIEYEQEIFDFITNS